MHRHEWLFAYSHEVIANAAQDKVDYHIEQADRYTVEFQEVADEIGYATPVQTNFFPNVISNPIIVGSSQPKADLRERLATVQQSRDFHRTQAKEFQIWATTLSAQASDASVTLDFDDIKYFGLYVPEEG